MSDKKQETNTLSFRERFLEQAGKYKRETVAIDGLGKVEIKEPSASERSNIYKAAQIVKQVKGETHIVTDPSKLNAWAVICCCIDPATGNPVVSKADLDTLLSMPVSILDKLAKPVMEFMGEFDDDEEAEKN